MPETNNKTTETNITKNDRLNCTSKEGESLPLAPAGNPSSATPSAGNTPATPPIRLATVFSGIGAIEHALDRMNLNHKIIFACDNGDLEI